MVGEIIAVLCICFAVAVVVYRVRCKSRGCACGNVATETVTTNTNDLAHACSHSCSSCSATGGCPMVSGIHIGFKEE